ncbi:MAG: restriction endonuclease subunit S [Salinivirgaceae bacterium]
MDKKSFSERDICTKFITPAVEKSGWNKLTQFLEEVSLEYINRCNNFMNARIYYASMGTGSSPSMKNITRKHMKRVLIPLPPLSEQYRIIQKLNELMHTCYALEATIKESASQNEKLLQQVLREALRIPVGKVGIEMENVEY